MGTAETCHINHSDNWSPSTSMTPVNTSGQALGLLSRHTGAMRRGLIESEPHWPRSSFSDTDSRPPLLSGYTYNIPWWQEHKSGQRRFPNQRKREKAGDGMWSCLFSVDYILSITPDSYDVMFINETKINFQRKTNKGVMRVGPQKDSSAGTGKWGPVGQTWPTASRSK